MEPHTCAVTPSHCLVLWQGARRASCPTVDNPWAAGSSCRTQSEHTGDWGSRYSGSKMTEGVIQPDMGETCEARSTQGGFYDTPQEGDTSP